MKIDVCVKKKKIPTAEIQSEAHYAYYLSIQLGGIIRASSSLNNTKNGATLASVTI